MPLFLYQIIFKRLNKWGAVLSVWYEDRVGGSILSESGIEKP